MYCIINAFYTLTDDDIHGWHAAAPVTVLLCCFECSHTVNFSLTVYMFVFFTLTQLFCCVRVLHEH